MSHRTSKLRICCAILSFLRNGSQFWISEIYFSHKDCTSFVDPSSDNVSEGVGTAGKASRESRWWVAEFKKYRAGKFSGFAIENPIDSPPRFQSLTSLSSFTSGAVLELVAE